MPQVNRAVFQRNARRAALRLQKEARSTALRLQNPPPPPPPPKPECPGCERRDMESYLHAIWCPTWAAEYSGDMSGF